MTQRLSWFGTALLLTFALASPASAGGLGGSLASMREQHRVAAKSHFTFVATLDQLRKLVSDRFLVRLMPSAELRLEKVSYPYARPSVVSFVERLAADYRLATGQPLVVTSLTRPLSKQPRNASPLSVHPAGMAVDLRMPANATQRQWLEKNLLALESRGVLDVTRERRPAHYHVAVYPEKYEVYASTLPPVLHFTEPPRTEDPRVASHESDLADATSGLPSLADLALIAFGLMLTTSLVVRKNRAARAVTA